MTNNFCLDGQVVIVTGASGNLGNHFAQVLADAGAAVALTARRITQMEKAVADITRAGGKAIAVELDVTDSGSVDAAFNDIEKSLGPVSLVINNAGIAVTKSILDYAESDWDRVMDTNLKGAWLVAQHAARRMSVIGDGNIINISSILGLRSIKGLPAYSVSKAGLNHLTKVMALELAPRGIRVNALAPGYIETDLNRDLFASDTGRALIKRIPQGRLGQFEDLDGALLLLASQASRYMTGTVITVDGGHLISSL